MRVFSKRDSELRKQPRRPKPICIATNTSEKNPNRFNHLGVYNCPEEVPRLIEDIQTLDLVIELLGRLDHRTISDGENESGLTIRRVSFILYAVRNKARDRLAREFLAGQPPIKPRTKPQTLADIWQLFKESLEKHEQH